MRLPLRAGAVRLAAAAAVVGALLTGCTGDISTPGEALQVLGVSLSPAYIGQAYDQPIQAAGGLRPYEFSLAEGQLPPGIKLQGGALVGTPEKTGRYTFTIQVSDANLSKTVQRFTLTVSEVPPPSLTFNVPDTQVRRQVTLRVQVSDARGLEGLRTQVRWDPQRFQLVDNSVQPDRRGIALLHHATRGQLEVALAFLGTRLDGNGNLFQFQLEPVAGASYLKIDAETEFMSAGGHHHFARLSQGRQPPPNPTGSSPQAPGSGSATPPDLPGRSLGGSP